MFIIVLIGFGVASLQFDEQARLLFSFVRRYSGKRDHVSQLRVLLPVGPNDERPSMRQRAVVRFRTVYMQLAELGMHTADMALRRSDGLPRWFGRSQLFGMQPISI